jgi:prolyl oligopeptidase
MMSKHNFRIVLSLSAALALAALISVACNPEPEPAVIYEEGKQPITRADSIMDMMHGTEVADPYRWLEDQESDDTRTWIDAQNSYTDYVLADLAGRDELTERYSNLMKTDDVRIPIMAGERLFYSKRLADQDLYVIYMRDGFDGEEVTLIDPHGLSDDHSTSVGISSISKDGTLLAYTIRQGGKDETEIRFLNVDTGEEMVDVLPASRYWGTTITLDKTGFYYSEYSMSIGPRFKYHEFGKDIKEDVVLYGEELSPSNIAFGTLSEDGDWLTVMVFEGTSGPTEMYIKSAKDDGEWQTVINDGKSRTYGAVADGVLYMWTNNEAPNYRVVKADPNNPGLENWTELIPEREDAVLRSISPAGGKLIANYLKDVRQEAIIYDTDGNKIRDISFDTIGSFGIVGDWDKQDAFLVFSSFHVPDTIYRYNMETEERSVWHELDVPVNSEDFVLKQVFYESKDGTQIPMFLLHKKGLELDGTTPTMLYGYGGFNSSMTPNFSARAIVWADMGGIYAVANLRGGGEYGEQWHQAGMFENKQNVFDDFIAAAEWLIDNNYTSSEHIGIRGGSNGGLLVGACMTQRPDLYNAVVCTYPLLDMVRYHKFMVASFWVSEYGSAEKPEQFEYIYKYSPYHNVKEGVDYPATLFITGDGDTRVAPLHARKMTALVQAKNSGKNPILLRYHTKAGHSGGMPMSERIANEVETTAFLKWCLFGE